MACPETVEVTHESMSSFAFERTNLRLPPAGLLGAY